MVNPSGVATKKSPGNWFLKPKRHLPLRSKILRGFTLPLLLAAGVSTLVYQVLTTNVATAEAVTESMQETAQINVLARAVVTAEASERGYAITGNEALLVRFRQANQTARRQITALLEEAEDEADEVAYFEEIGALFTRWLTEVAGPVVRARQNAPVGLAVEAERVHTNFLRVANAELAYQLTGEPEALSAWRKQLIGVRNQLAAVLASDLPEAQKSAWREVLASSDTYELGISQRGSGEAGESANALAATLGELALAAQVADERALEIIRSGAGQVLIAQIEKRANSYRQQEQAELREMIAVSNANTRRARWVAVLGPVLAVVLGLGTVWLLLREVVRATGLIARTAQGLAGGDLNQRVALHRNDELGALAGAFNTMAERLAAREQEAVLLDQMGNLLHTCTTLEEAYTVAVRFGAQLFKSEAGALYVISASRNVVERVANWGPPEALNGAIFAPDECWALRSGRSYLLEDASTGIGCKHLPNPPPAATLCIPLVSQDETLGIFHLSLSISEGGLSEDKQRLGASVAEQLALALSNLRLREALRNQSIRDPLTGLFNRRYLEETLERDLRRAARMGKPLGLIIFDIDHFKRFNDTFGHDAGDLVLRELAALVRQTVRGSDIACRYGGEEFVLALPEVGLEDARLRAEELRKAVKTLELNVRGQALGGISLSLGVAAFPQHGDSGETLVNMADQALYRAKREGRDRVVTVDSNPTQGTPG